MAVVKDVEGGYEGEKDQEVNHGMVGTSHFPGILSTVKLLFYSCPCSGSRYPAQGFLLLFAQFPRLFWGVSTVIVSYMLNVRKTEKNT